MYSSHYFRCRWVDAWGSLRESMVIEEAMAKYLVLKWLGHIVLMRNKKQVENARELTQMTLWEKATQI